MLYRIARLVAGAACVLVVYLCITAPLEIHRGEKGKPFVTSYMTLHGSIGSNWTPLIEVSPILICAAVKAEDRFFFQHRGFDFKSISNGIIDRLEGKPLNGGSTISQQTIKNMFLSPERRWTRKITEAFLTIRLEHSFSKRSIIELYLNAIEWGKGIWGVEQASQKYFHKTPRALNLEESLFLSSIIARPRAEFTEEALKRMEQVYTRVNWQLQHAGFYSEDRQQSAQTLWDQFKSANARNILAHDAIGIFSSGHSLYDLTLERILESGCGADREPS